MLVAFSSPVKFSKSVFLLCNLVQGLCKVQLLSVVANHSKSGFSTVNCVVESQEIR